MRIYLIALFLPLSLMASGKFYVSPESIVINEQGIFYVENGEWLFQLRCVALDEKGLYAEAIFGEPWYCPKPCCTWNGGQDKVCRNKNCRKPRPN